MPSEAPVSIETRALGTLDYIRDSIESSGSLVVPGTAGVLMGGIGLLATLIASLTHGSVHWLIIWLIACLAALLVGAALMARQAAQTGHARYLGPVRKFLLCLCPALLAGAVLSIVLWHANMQTLLPGTWLLLYGCAVLSASTVTIARTRTLIAGMGAVFVVLGCAAYLMPAADHNVILGLGFGVVHLVSGLLIARITSHAE
ncbi:MAG TPA: hypothetical protein VKT22_11375 [Steroidobacteraceae bacterium]|nr:hypothetical protein [Steroidobacteraceae bacterium]